MYIQLYPFVKLKSSNFYSHLRCLLYSSLINTLVLLML